MRAGYFAETLLRFLQLHLRSQFTPFGTKIRDFAAECRALETVSATPNDEGIRVIIPRALNFLYTLRNKRGIGHVGGDVDANAIDAATCVRVADWCMCELIRVFHSLSLEEAQAILDALSVRQLPVVWAVGGRKRILNSSLDLKSQVLVLLHGEPETGVAVEELGEWVEHGHPSNFRRDVLRPLHRARLIEYDEEAQMAIISPLGIQKVEEELLPSIKNGAEGP